MEELYKQIQQLSYSPHFSGLVDHLVAKQQENFLLFLNSSGEEKYYKGKLAVYTQLIDLLTNSSDKLIAMKEKQENYELAKNF